MGQGDIYKFLLKNKGKKYTVAQLSELLKVNHSSISMTIKRMLRTNVYNIKIDWKKNDNKKKKMLAYIK